MSLYIINANFIQHTATDICTFIDGRFTIPLIFKEMKKLDHGMVGIYLSKWKICVTLLIWFRKVTFGMCCWHCLGSSNKFERISEWNVRYKFSFSEFGAEKAHTTQNLRAFDIPLHNIYVYEIPKFQNQNVLHLDPFCYNRIENIATVYSHWYRFS